MTAVAGIVHDGQVWIGADSASVSGLSLKTRADPKVFTRGPWVIGFTASWRMGQAVMYGTELPAPPSRGDLHEFMCTAFVDALRKRLRSAGWAAVKDSREHGGTFLAGVRGQLFEVGSEYGVGQRAEPYNAIGCGQDLALGSLYSTATAAMSPQERITLALGAAERFSSGVRGPWCIRHTVNDSALAAAVQEDKAHA